MTNIIDATDHTEHYKREMKRIVNKNIALGDNVNKVTSVKISHLQTLKEIMTYRLLIV